MVLAKPPRRCTRATLGMWQNGNKSQRRNIDMARSLRACMRNITRTESLLTHSVYEYLEALDALSIIGLYLNGDKVYAVGSSSIVLLACCTRSDSLSFILIPSCPNRLCGFYPLASGDRPRR